MSTPISVGDKIVCLSDGWNRTSRDPLMAALLATVDPAPPVKDGIYCVREVYMNANNEPALRLVGILSPSVPVFGELGWRAQYFRRIWTHDGEVEATNVKPAPQTRDPK